MTKINTFDGDASESRQHRMDRGHYLALDSLRGICACCVALSHFHSDGWISQSPIIVRASLFVDFFFVLSGFVIMASYGDKLSQGMSIFRFQALRLGRIYPLHVVMLLAIGAVQLIGSAFGSTLGLTQLGSYQVSAFFRSLFLVQIFTTAEPGSWNPPAWSIAAEFWTYLIFALLLRLPKRFFLPATIALIVISPQFSPGFVFTIRTGALPRCIYGFGIGIICFSVWKKYSVSIKSIKKSRAAILEILSVSATYISFCFAPPEVTYFLCPWLFAAIILLVASQRGPLSAFLLKKPFLVVGTLSYSIYMTHEFVEARIVNILRILHVRLDAMADPDFTHQFITQTYPFPFASDVVTLAALISVIAVSYMTYRFIEDPARVWSRRLLYQAARTSTPEDGVLAVLGEGVAKG